MADSLDIGGIGGTFLSAWHDVNGIYKKTREGGTLNEGEIKKTFKDLEFLVSEKSKKDFHSLEPESFKEYLKGKDTEQIGHELMTADLLSGKAFGQAFIDPMRLLAKLFDISQETKFSDTEITKTLYKTAGRVFKLLSIMFKNLPEFAIDSIK